MKKNATKRTSSGSRRRKRQPRPAARRQDDPVLRPVPTAIAKWWEEELAKAQAEYLADTGEAMPMNVEEVRAVACLAGYSPAEAVAGDYTLHDIHGKMIDRTRLEQRHAIAVVEAFATNKAAALVDKYQRAADRLTMPAKKILALWLREKATSEASCLTRDFAIEVLGLSESRVKRAIENSIAAAAASIGADIFGTTSGIGTWLTPEGVEVAKRIDPRILS